VFYGRQDDRKHYEKIAREIQAIDSNLVAEVFAGEFPFPRGGGSTPKSGLLIRVYEVASTVGWSFWVNPEDENWVFIRASKASGTWECSSTERGWHVGHELFHWNQEEDLVHFRNFAATTARLFLRDGPFA
jgi:hypothetical protein